MSVARQFEANLARIRKRADMSQEEVSFRASVHRTEVSHLSAAYGWRGSIRSPSWQRPLRVDPGDSSRASSGSRGRATRAVQARRHRYALTVAKKSKKPADLNRLAAAIVGEATDETPQEPERSQVRAG